MSCHSLNPTKLLKIGSRSMNRDHILHGCTLNPLQCFFVVVVFFFVFFFLGGGGGVLTINRENAKQKQSKNKCKIQGKSHMRRGSVCLTL